MYKNTSFKCHQLIYSHSALGGSHERVRRVYVLKAIFPKSPFSCQTTTEMSFSCMQRASCDFPRYHCCVQGRAILQPLLWEKTVQAELGAMGWGMQDQGPRRAAGADRVSKENAAPSKINLISETAENIKHLPGWWCLATGKNVLSGEYTWSSIIRKET